MEVSRCFSLKARVSFPWTALEAEQILVQLKDPRETCTSVFDLNAWHPPHWSFVRLLFALHLLQILLPAAVV
ncbi:MAG: hypothetical protein WCJ99_13625, partial [Betaproteobacteria bacterium]